MTPPALRLELATFYPLSNALLTEKLRSANILYHLSNFLIQIISYHDMYVKPYFFFFFFKKPVLKCCLLIFSFFFFFFFVGGGGGGEGISSGNTCLTVTWMKVQNFQNPEL